MAKHTPKEWYMATRPWSFTVSSMPVVLTTSFLFWASQHSTAVLNVNWLAAALALVGIILFHAGGNVLSDYNDHRKGVDEGLMHMPLINGSFQPKEYLALGSALLAFGVVVGLILIWLTGFGILWVGLVGALLTVAYSWLKYHALGDLQIILCFGVLPVLGTSLVVVGEIYWPALVLAIPLGFITDGVLHSNNSRDIASDRKAGIRTFAMLIGEKASVAVYAMLVLLPFVLVVMAVIMKVLPWASLAVLVVAPMAWKLCRRMSVLPTEGGAAVDGVDVATSQLQLFFSLLLSAALVVSAFIA